MGIDTSLHYLAPEICKGASHTKYSDIYIALPLLSIPFDVIDGKQYNPYFLDNREELQQTFIAAHDNFNLNKPIREKRFNSEEMQSANHDIRYKSRIISKPRKMESTGFTHGKFFIWYI
ncbi:hypothetical protein G9A89_008706 [Geosiphon pyriformis]|nr:hypothetical protein G9A89_008706 [Geosiphon pyriformis]